MIYQKQQRQMNAQGVNIARYRERVRTFALIVGSTGKDVKHARTSLGATHVLFAMAAHGSDARTSNRCVSAAANFADASIPESVVRKLRDATMVPGNDPLGTCTAAGYQCFEKPSSEAAAGDDRERRRVLIVEPHPYILFPASRSRTDALRARRAHAV